MRATLKENTIIAGRYRLVRTIGRGGMGSVWLATNVRLDVPCALKFIEEQIADKPEVLARFELEAKSAAQIRSPNVVHVIDYGHHEGMPYIAMELLEGEDLGRRLSRVLRLTPAETCSVVVQVCRALQKAHSREIVHRDLKPENIFLVREDDRDLVKVLDFGIAKRFSYEHGAPSETVAGTMLGTPAYMSPEQAQGNALLDYRTDLWALAVLVFRCLTGALPFRSEALGDLLLKIIVSPLPVPSKVAVDLPPGFDAWWERAASRDPSRRFQTAKEFAQALEKALGVAPMFDAPDRSSDMPMVGEGASPLAQSIPNALPPQLGYARSEIAHLASESLSPASALPDAAGSPPTRHGWLGTALMWVALLGAVGAVVFVALRPPNVSPASAAAAAGAPSVPVVVGEEEEPAPARRPQSDRPAPPIALPSAQPSPRQRWVPRPRAERAGEADAGNGEATPKPAVSAAPSTFGSPPARGALLH